MHFYSLSRWNMYFILDDIVLLSSNYNYVVWEKTYLDQTWLWIYFDNRVLSMGRLWINGKQLDRTIWKPFITTKEKNSPFRRFILGNFFSPEYRQTGIFYHSKHYLFLSKILVLRKTKFFKNFIRKQIVLDGIKESYINHDH